MEAKSYQPYIVIILLLLLTSLALAFTVDVNVSNKAGVKVFFPEKMGEWTGSDLRFCQSRDCQKEFAVDTLSDPDVCPVCGSELSAGTWAEHELLPGDTEILKTRYTHPSGKVLFTSLVLSGSERVSIHRPQICLVGQGNEITKQEVIGVPLDEGRELDVMVLDTMRHIKLSAERTVDIPRYYAYWFVGKGRETASHYQRMIWMASDRILHNVSHRWAYIAVSGAREPESEEYFQEISDFVAGLYPEMALQ